MVRFQRTGDIVRQMTAEEETAADTLKAQIDADIKSAKDAQAEKDTNKASGKQKLKDLGLNDDEIKALTGA